MGMKFGPLIGEDGVLFRLWAPNSRQVHLAVEGSPTPLVMARTPDGWHVLKVPGVGAGASYAFVLSDGRRVPDPASRFQPFDVHGPSEVVDPDSYSWSDISWRGRPWEDCVAYELHVGTFTPEGTFAAAMSKLDALAELGITAVSLMPVADFPGVHNWGYDGALLFAPESSYGRPDDFRRFVDRAHSCGLMVFLDVVYNHFGPEGNYLPLYAPIFTERHHTPWGAAVNYDAEGAAEVRAFVVANAAYWIEEYHLDGLRLDAVDAILDDSGRHILEEIAAAARRVAPHREVHLILENGDNSARLLERDEKGTPRLFTAQWNDDVHHVLHAAATGERSGYYEDYAGDTELLGRTLAEGFAFQGEVMPYRGRPRGERSAHLPPTAFVSFIQNHDQVGNRAFGERLVSLAPAPAVRAVASIYLLAPQIPMLFMGEEWGAEQPFLFFSDLEPDLADRVREGRRAEFGRFMEFADPDRHAHIPDPKALETFLSAKLDWEDAVSEAGREWRGWYQRILETRRKEIVPRLKNARGGSTFSVLGAGSVRIVWILGDGSHLVLKTNLSDTCVKTDLPAQQRCLWSEGMTSDDELGPWSVRWSLGGPA